MRSANWNYGGAKFKLSRSKIDLFTECPRCFYIDNRLGIARPRGPSFTLNIAVDALLKKEFDIHRAQGTPHPLMKKYGLDAVPFKHSLLSTWQENFEGIQYFHEPTGLTISGAIDDIWVNPHGELIIVDYKATAKDGKIEALSDSGWESQYKRQMEIYQWLFRKSGFKVSSTGYFVYVNGKKDKEAFDGKLEFDVTLIPHTGTDTWVEEVIMKAKTCLDDSRIPLAKSTCEYCKYRDEVGSTIRSLSSAPVEEKPKKVARKTRTKKVVMKRGPTLF